MLPFCLYSLLVLTSQAADGADRTALTTAPPPVLKKYEPTDSVVVTLPGSAVSAMRSPLPATEVHMAPPAPDPERPVLRRSKHEYPPEFDRDSAEYLDQQIGIWQQVDAQACSASPPASVPPTTTIRR